MKERPSESSKFSKFGKFGTLNEKNSAQSNGTMSSTADFWIEYETVADGIQIQEFDTGAELRTFIMDNKATFINDLKVVALLPEITDCSNLFSGCTATSIDLSEFNTSNITNMSSMFAWSYSLVSLELGDFDTSSATNMSNMFRSCSSLTSLDLSNFDTSSVTDMRSMFAECSSLTSLDLSSFDTSSVIGMDTMFSDCSSLTSLDVSGFDTSNVIGMSLMFAGCSSLTSLDLSNFDTSSVTDMSGMFFNCSSLTSLDVSGFDTSNVISMNLMFYNCSKLTSLDVSNFDTSSVTDMRYMFLVAENLTHLTLGENFAFKGDYPTDLTTDTADGIYTGKWIRDDLAYGPFTPTELESNYTSEMAGTWKRELTPADFWIKYETVAAGGVRIREFDTGAELRTFIMNNKTTFINDLKVVALLPEITDCSRLLYGCTATSIDLSEFNTSNVTNMSDTFYDSQATTLDLGSFDTSNVIDMNNMFLNSQATTGYARTQADADRFNTSSGKPAGLTFIVKP